LTQRHRSPDGALVANTAIGDYVIVREIGRGGFGITYEARNRLHQSRALKEFALTGLQGSALTGGTSTEELAKIRDWALQRFKDTTFQLARLEHPNIVRVDDYIAGENTGFMVMELLKGNDLAQFIRARAPMALKDVRVAIEPIMDALDYMHERGIIHRDIKPENIMFRGDGTPVLIDFGTVRAISTEAASQAARLGQTRFSPRDSSQTYAVLSPRYAAPEQDDPDHALKPAVDVFAIGAIMYEMLTGKPPMESGRRMGRFASGGEDPVVRLQTTMTGSAADLAAMKVVDSALELPVSKRPASIAAFRQALGWASAPAPVAAKSPAARPAAKLAASRTPVSGLGKKLAALAVGLVLLAGSGVAFYEWRSREATALMAKEQAAREQAAIAAAAREAEQRRLAAEEAARTSAEAADRARQVTLQRQQQEAEARTRASEAEAAAARQRAAEQQATAHRTQQERSVQELRRLDEQRQLEEQRRLAEERADADRLHRQQQLAAEQALLRQREVEIERERQRLEASQRALEQQLPVPALPRSGLGQALLPLEPERPRLSDEAITGSDRTAASPVLEEELLAALTAKGCHLGSKASSTTLAQTEEALTRFLAKTKIPRPAQPFTQGFLDQVRQTPDTICAQGARPQRPVVARPQVTRPKAARAAPAQRATPRAARSAPAANPKCFIANGQQFCG
jgi:serine/threonine protein kinase